MANAGYTVIGGTRLSTDRGIYFRVQANADGDVGSVFAHLDTASATVNVRAAIYASTAQDLTGVPTGSPLAVSNDSSQNIANGSATWVELTFASPLAVTNGTYYHIFVGTSGSGAWGLSYDDNNQDDNQLESTAIGNTTVPDPADISGTNTDWSPSMYMVITESGGSPPTVSGVTGNNAEGTITINGANFTGATGVTNGGLALTGITVVNDGQITATNVSGGLAYGSSNDIVVTTPDGSNAGFASTFNPPVGMEYVVVATPAGGIWNEVSGIAVGDHFAHDDLLPGGYTWDVDEDGAPTVQSGIPTDIYTVNVRFLDASDSYSVVADTLDIDWHEAPEMAGAASPTVAENQTTVGTYAAITGSTPITYSLTGADAALFTVNPSTGAVIFNDAPDYEAWVGGGAIPYEITVVAANADNDMNPYTATQAVSISLSNVNEPAVINNQTFSANDGAGPGQAVIGVVASDPEGATLTYAITAGNTNTDWSIGLNTGILTNLNALDSGVTAAYSLTVEVDDGVNPADSATITINVVELAELAFTGGIAKGLDAVFAGGIT